MLGSLRNGFSERNLGTPLPGLMGIVSLVMILGLLFLNYRGGEKR